MKIISVFIRHGTDLILIDINTRNLAPRLKVIDPKGEQVSGLVALNAEDLREKLSSGKALDFEETIFITKEVITSGATVAVKCSK
ncbi:MAG: DUF1989 domain-containing protein [Saprospiraceae bacterium]